MKTDLATAFLAPFIFTLTSCVVTYTDFPSVDLQTEPLPRKEFPIYYNVDSLAYLERAMTHPLGGGPFFRYAIRLPLLTAPTRQDYAELERVFAETRVFSKAIPTSTPPERGIYCLVDVIHKLPSEPAGFLSAMTYASFGFVPSYSDSSGYIVKYALYMDRELKKEYRYEITRKGGAWLGLIPFIWVNLLTPSEEDAFRATAYQFFLDAERDGYLRSM